MRKSPMSLQLLTATICVCIFIQAAKGQDYDYDAMLTQERINAESELLRLLQISHGALLRRDAKRHQTTGDILFDKNTWSLSSQQPGESLIRRRPTRVFSGMHHTHGEVPTRAPTPSQKRSKRCGAGFGSLDEDIKHSQHCEPCEWETVNKRRPGPRGIDFGDMDFDGGYFGK